MGFFDDLGKGLSKMQEKADRQAIDTLWRRYSVEEIRQIARGETSANSTGVRIAQKALESRGYSW